MKNITNHEHYFIDELGNIYSDKYNTIRKLKQWEDKKGYIHVELDRKNYRVHRLVALEFIPNPNNLPQVNHKDGNKLNNNVDNLEWCTNAENQIHAYINNLQPQRINNNRKLSEDNVLEILNSNLSQRALAKKFNVNRATIKSIIDGTMYKDIVKKV
jgi:hypothetical protein